MASVRTVLTALLRSVPVIGPGAPPVVNTGSHPWLRGDDFYMGDRGLSQPYKNNPWVMRAIQHVAEPIAGLPLRFATPGANGKLNPYNNPDLDSFWQRPSLGPEGPQSLSMTVRATIIRKKLDGHCFWAFDDTWLSGSNVPPARKTPFLIIPAGAMTPIFESAARGKVIGWNFRDASGRDWKLLPEQVLHPAYFDPYDPTGGASQYQAVKVAAEADTFASRFMRALMKGNGDRGPIISPKDKTVVFTPEQEAQMTAAILEKRNANLRGEFKPIFLGAAVEVADPQVESPDAQFMQGKAMHRDEIFAGLGVPPSMAEAKAKYSTGAENDRRVLIEDTCKPESVDIAAVIALAAMRQLGMTGQGGDHLLAFFDWSKHSVMQAVREDQIKGTAKELFAMGWPWKQISAYLGLDTPDFEGSDVGFLPYTLQRMSDALAETPGGENVPDKLKDGTTTPALPDKEDGAKMLLRLFSGPVPGTMEHALRGKVVSVDTKPPLALPGGLSKAASDANERQWRRQMARRTPMEKATKKVASKILYGARKDVLAKLESGAKKRAADDPDEDEADPRRPDDVLFDLTDFERKLVAGLDKISRVHIQQAADFVRSDMGVDDPWSMPAQATLQALASRKNLIRDCAEGVFDDVKETLAEGFSLGETTAELAQRVRDVFNGFDDSRAQTIAITEAGAAFGAGSRAGAISAGAKSKTWISARDSRVRHTHTEADGQTVGLEDYFRVGGELAQYPCAEGLSAKEACNCRCDVLYRVAPVEGSA